MTANRLTRLVQISILGALGFLLMYTLELRVPLFPEFIKYDPGDVPALIATYFLGPAAGASVQGIKVVLFWISGKSTAGWVGVLANLIVGLGMVLGPGLAYRMVLRQGIQHWAWSVLSILVGTALMSAVLLPILALVIYPFWGMQGAAAWTAAITISTPFNLFKGLVSSSISMLLYRRLQPYLSLRTNRDAA